MWGAEPGLIRRIGAYDDFFAGSSAWTIPATAGAERGTIETSANKLNFDTIDFDGAGVENAQLALVLPDWYDLGAIKLKILSTPAAGASAADGYVWGAKGASIAIDDDLDQAYGDEVEVTETVTAAGDFNVAITPAITIGGSPGRGDLLLINLARKVADGDDDMTEDARLLAVRVQWKQRPDGPLQW
jgi:hypothetical protein